MDIEKLKKAEALAEEKPWLLPPLFASLACPLALLAGLVGGFVLIGYALDIESMYRPGAASATHPLTAVCLVLTASFFCPGCFGMSRTKYAVVPLVMTAIVLISIVVDMLSGSHIAAYLTPFISTVNQELQLGKSNSMGWNSNLMFLMVLVAALLWRCDRPLPTQIMAFMAATIPATALTGYAYGFSVFYGAMSPYTAVGGFLLCLSVLTRTANTGALRAILSPYYGGRISRLQITASGLLPWVLGFVMIQFLDLENGAAVGAYVICITWFSFVLVSISALYLDKSERSRRDSERLLVEAAMSDQLTSLPNRRRFFQFGEYEVARAQRTQNVLWLLMLDLDSFKRSNDTAGHDMGDKVLKAVATAIRNAVRSVDLASRLGGEEFAVLLVDSNEQGARRVAESIREQVEALQIIGWTDLHGPVTVSIGGCELTASGSLDGAIKTADKCLYDAKHTGKNRVHIG